MEYLFQGKLDNTIHDITYDQIKALYYNNKKEADESFQITQSSYKGENFYQGKNFYHELEKEYLYRDPLTSGMRFQYPHGIILQQSMRRNYYRGENQVYKESVPSLLRKINTFNTVYKKELYRIVADMRISEFSFLLNKFEHVKNWKYCDVLYDILAQHYGLETGWLDITSDFNVALFFATCYFDKSEKKWRPLTKKQTEVSEDKKYGMIFHMPSNRMTTRWIVNAEKFCAVRNSSIKTDNQGNSQEYKELKNPKFTGETDNLAYPIGFQPFMRCHMQNGYAIYMRTSHPLQQDFEFEKLRFRHNENLSKYVFEMMNGGELIYPHEGLKRAEFIIDKISTLTTFSEKAFMYALQHSHKYRMADKEKCREDLSKFVVDGHEIKIINDSAWKISSGRRKRIEDVYKDFSIEAWYGIHVMEKNITPSGSDMFEPWMILENATSPGKIDFTPRHMYVCSNLQTMKLMGSINMLIHKQQQDFI